LASDGNFYGTTHYGGAYGNGTLFLLTPRTNWTVLVSFDGAVNGSAWCGLVQGDSGDFFSAADADLQGFCRFFKVNTNGTVTTLCVLPDLCADPSTLVQGRDGNFYGTTYHGGTADAGTVLRMTPSGVLTTLYSFTGGVDGGNPIAGLFQSTNGYYYGTTQHGGITNGSPTGYGTIFKLKILPTPLLQSPTRRGDQVTFSWDTVPGETYELQYVLDLSQTNWHNLVTTNATQYTTTVSDSIASDLQRYYRLVVLP
jgi:uncharacterized repeat protein (TIGR03803 family)